jgi:predicted RNA-binding Zn-ribbon protein involved in translation (DUF1610 family)
MRDDIDKPLCDHCGQTLEHFLNQMEEHNLDVVCPACGKTVVAGSKKGDANRSDSGEHAPNQPTKPDHSHASSPGNLRSQKKN